MKSTIAFALLLTGLGSAMVMGQAPSGSLLVLAKSDQMLSIQQP